MVVGLKSLRNKLERKIPKAVREEVAKRMEAYAERIVATMKRRAPKQFGDLVASIGWTWGAAPAGSIVIGQVGATRYGTMRITIYAGSSSTIVTNARGLEFQNAFLQEYGTKDMPPTPYFFVTWRQFRRGAKAATTRAIKKGLSSGAR